MADEAKALTIEDMIGMLSTDQAQPSLSAAEPEAKADAPAASESTPAPEVEAQPASPESESSQDSQGEQSDSASGAGQTQETQEQKQEEKKFTPKEKDEVPAGVQKRIDKAIWEKHEAERKAEAALREAEELKKRLEEKDQASGKPASGEPPKEKPPEKPAFQFAEAKPERKVVKQDDFETIDEYLNARDEASAEYQEKLAEWRYRREKAEDAEREMQAIQQRELQELQGTWSTKIQEFEKAEPKIRESINAVGPFLTQAGQSEFIMKSAVGPQMVDYIAKHQDEWIPIAKTGDPRNVAYELGKLEARLTKQSPPQSAPKTKPDKPNGILPEPVLSVGGKSAPAKGVDLSDPKTSMEDFQREFARQLEASNY